MATKKYNVMIETFKKLSPSEQKKWVDSLMDIICGENDNDSSCGKLVREHTFKDEKPDCPHCHAKAALGNIQKKGFKGNGAQRYYCKACKKHFVSTTNTVFCGSRKGSDVWEKFVSMTIAGESLQFCADECHISYVTAFTWRHKFLNALVQHQNSITLSGKIELDEMLIPISYKGNHVSGGFGGRELLPGMDNNLPRESFKRGSDNKSMSSKDKACVFCMIKNNNEVYYADVPGVGFMLPSMLDKTIGKHVCKEDSLILADQYKITKNYLEANSYEHMILASNTSDNNHDHKPEINGEYHIQHVNAMHRHIRLFLAKYCGVSTKYLANYIALFTWLKNVRANKQQKRLNEVSLYRASNPDCYITRQAIEALPAVPSCA